jgi:hypothetical protein
MAQEDIHAERGDVERSVVDRSRIEDVMQIMGYSWGNDIQGKAFLDVRESLIDEFPSRKTAGPANVLV